MNLISTEEAAKQKDVTRQAINKAVRRGDIDGEKMGPRFTAIKENKRFLDWEPMRGKQLGGRARAKKAKKAKKVRKKP